MENVFRLIQVYHTQSFNITTFLKQAPGKIGPREAEQNSIHKEKDLQSKTQRNKETGRQGELGPKQNKITACFSAKL